jgi:hypothetical protein
MKLIIKALVFSFMMTFFISCRDKNELVEFKPLYFDDNGQYVIQKDIPKNFYTNLKKVLDEYRVSHIDSNGVIFVKWKDYQNKELVSNYTIKALDEDWLNSR